MPRPKKTEVKHPRVPLLNTRVIAEDYARLEELCKVTGKTKTELVREAVIQYLDRAGNEYEEKAKDRLIARLNEFEARFIAEQKKATERLAKIGSRNLIDVGQILQILYKRADPNTRGALWDESRKGSLKRLEIGKQKGDPEAAELAKKELGEKA